MNAFTRKRCGNRSVKSKRKPRRGKRSCASDAKWSGAGRKRSERGRENERRDVGPSENGYERSSERWMNRGNENDTTEGGGMTLGIVTGIEIGIGTVTVPETMTYPAATIVMKEHRLAIVTEEHGPRRQRSSRRHRLPRWTIRRWRKPRCSCSSKKARRWRPSQGRNRSSTLMMPMRPRMAASRLGRRLQQSRDTQPAQRRLDLAGRGARRVTGTITDGTIAAEAAAPVGHGADDATGREIDRCIRAVMMIESLCVTSEMIGATTVGVAAAEADQSREGTIATGGTGAETGEIATTLLTTVTIAGTIDILGAIGIEAGSESESENENENESVIETGMTRRGEDHAPARHLAIATADGLRRDLDLGGDRGLGLGRGAMAAISPPPEKKNNDQHPDQGLVPEHAVTIEIKKRIIMIRIVAIDPHREPRDIAHALDGVHNPGGVLLPDGDRALDEDLHPAVAPHPDEDHIPDGDLPPAIGLRTLNAAPVRGARQILTAMSRRRATAVGHHVVERGLRFTVETETLVHCTQLLKWIGTFPERTEMAVSARRVANANAAETGSGHGPGKDPGLDTVSANVRGIEIGIGTVIVIEVETAVAAAVAAAAAAAAGVETGTDPEIGKIGIGTVVGIAIVIATAIVIERGIERRSGIGIAIGIKVGRTENIIAATLWTCRTQTVLYDR